MIAFLSPAKNMRPAPAPGVSLTRPVFQREADRLASLLRKYSPWELESLLQINPSLAMKAAGYYQDFAEAPATAALSAYYGLAFQHLDAASLTPEDYAWAGEHLRILSALYGVLRPADGIRPYRLELQSRLRVEGQSLYAFWGERIARELFKTGEPVIHLASGEYARAVLPHRRPGDICITCEFSTLRRGRRVTLATGAKMARGEMARFLIKNRLERPANLRAFEWEGYAFAPALSDETRYVFLQTPVRQDTTRNMERF